MINLMAKALKPVPMSAPIQANSIKAKSKGLANSNGRMGIFIKVCFSIMQYKDQANLPGSMKKRTKENGRKA